VTRLVVASGNPHKVAELRELLEAAIAELEVVGLDRWADAPTIDETADTFAGNAELKARGIAEWLASRGEDPHTWVLADDSGICVDALGGDPGVRSARFAGAGASDADNNRRLVQELRSRGLDRSAAHYACVLALVRVGGGAVHRFEGRWDVQVRVHARGSGGFGYDPHAYLDAGARTVAELDRAAKAEVSHRGRALRNLVSGWPG
jgi:XTP/dITP diphosphohydrolase